jgi:hypothetical protein
VEEVEDEYFVELRKWRMSETAPGDEKYNEATTPPGGKQPSVGEGKRGKKEKKKAKRSKHAENTEAAFMAALRKEDIPRLQQQWEKKCEQIFGNFPDKLPPLRRINHTISLIDEKMAYHYRQPKCPDAYRPALLEKLQRYVKAGWWKAAVSKNAVPMLCVPKSAKNPELRTVFDLREQNANTHKDITPLPDQDVIRNAVAAAKYRSKMDLSNAYESIRVEPSDVHKTAFATVYGVFVSNVMQQGDCNAPSTFQRFITDLLQDFIGRFVYAYLDDIFIFSDTVEEHENHIRMVMEKLQEAEMIINPRKCDFYSKRMDCLGHIIDDKGIHTDSNKMEQVINWRVPRNAHDVQRFLGLIQYLQQFMPNVSAFMSPLSAITRNGRSFEWRPLHQKCFDEIKAMARKTPILRPINVKDTRPIWVICDASLSGIGAMYGQGEDWQTCRPAGFMSKKFQNAQFNYRVFEMETIAILEALNKWEDKLIGRKFTIVTDHKALEFFARQPKLSSRQTRWMEYLSRFDYHIQYVKGVHNKVADCLSRYYESDQPDEIHARESYVHVDERLDPDQDDLPMGPPQRFAAMRKKKPKKTRAKATPTKNVDAPLKDQTPPLATILTTEPDFFTNIRGGYAKDPVFRKILDDPSQFANFKIEDGLIYLNRGFEGWVLCVPRSLVGGHRFTELIIEQGHKTIGHLGGRKTASYVKKSYWWPTVTKDVISYCESCGTCQATKESPLKPQGLLHTLPVPEHPWQSIGMDFIGPLPKTDEGFDFIWVVICRFSSMVHLVPIAMTTGATDLAARYIYDIIRLHGVPESIVSDRDPRFTAKFWEEVQRLLGTKLMMSTAFHPQTDGATERANRTVNGIMRAVIAPDQKDWVRKLPMVEFAINSAQGKSTGYAPFELNYTYVPTLRGLLDRIPATLKPGVRNYASKAQENLLEAHDAIIAARVDQTHFANRKRRPEPQYKVSDRVWLSTENLTMPKGRARKWLPKFIGPFTIIEAQPESSNYVLDLPMEMSVRNIHPRFHASKLRPAVPNDDQIFPKRDAQYAYDYGEADDMEWGVDQILSHRWKGRSVEFLVKWTLGDTTWEPLRGVDELEALDRYLELFGLKGSEWRKLPRRSPGNNKGERM